MIVPIHAHTNPCLVPPPVQSVLFSLPGPICSSTSFHVHIHSLLSLHKKLPPTQSSPYWVLISFNTGESSRLFPEVPFQYPFASKRFESTNITQKKLHMEYFKPVSPISYRLSLSPASPFSAFSEPHLCGGKKLLSRHFGFSGIKNIVQLLLFIFFFQKNEWLLALCMNQDKVRVMVIDLGLPLWPPLQGLGQKNQLMALYCFVTYYICVFFLLILWKKMLLVAMKAL